MMVMRTECITVDADSIRAAVVPARRRERINIYTPGAARLRPGAVVTWRGERYRVESVNRGMAAAARENEHAII